MRAIEGREGKEGGRGKEDQRERGGRREVAKERREQGHAGGGTRVGKGCGEAEIMGKKGRRRKGANKDTESKGKREDRRRGKDGEGEKARWKCR